jgi:hypothetical protein
MKNELNLNNSSLVIDNTLSKSFISSEDIDEKYNYYWGNKF